MSTCITDNRHYEIKTGLFDNQTTLFVYRLVNNVFFSITVICLKYGMSCQLNPTISYARFSFCMQIFHKFRRTILLNFAGTIFIFKCYSFRLISAKLYHRVVSLNVSSMRATSINPSGRLVAVRNFIVNSMHKGSPTKFENFPDRVTAFTTEGGLCPLCPPSGATPG